MTTAAPTTGSGDAVPGGGGPDAGDPRVVVCLGAGGVGKTTVAAALAIRSASRGHRTVVLTIDPARRLADVLGLGPTRAGSDPTAPATDPAPANAGLGNEPRLVPGPWPGELWAAMLDPGETFDGVVRDHGGSGADGLLRTITSSLSGANEYMAAERLHQLATDPRFDRIVVDTPPSRHAIDFLDSPGRLARFVDSRLFGVVLAPRGRRFDPAAAAARLLARLTSRLVGSDLLDQVISLLADLDGLAEGLAERAGLTADLLTGPSCHYVVVTSARAEPIRHADWILDRLAGRDLVAGTVIVNRLTPAPAGVIVSGGRGVDRHALETNLAQLSALAGRERLLIAELAGRTGVPAPLTLTERDLPVNSVEELLALAVDLDRAMGGPVGER